MIFTYVDDNGDEFEYDTSTTALEFVTQNKSNKAILELAKDYWQNGLTSDEQKKYMLDYEIAGVDEETDPEIITQLIMDADDEGWLDEELEEEMRDFYESDAKETHEDNLSYQQDPYAYNGVSKSDFF